MSKKGSGRYQANYNYNRQSQGYQKNLYRQKMNAENIKAPKTVDPKKYRIAAISAGVVWVIVSVLLVMKLKWIGVLISVIIAAVVVGGAYLYLRNKQNEIIRYYKKIGLTEELYIQELKRRNTPQKQLDTYRKLWRKVKVD